jgi:predicted O-methyltransferase YrrM
MLAFRLALVARHASAAARSPGAAARYLLRGRELTNLTYDLENASEIAGVLAEALRTTPQTVLGFVRELEDDDELRHALRGALDGQAARERDPVYGKRFVPYAIARITRPKLVVETGTADGLGTAVLATALRRNAQEGFPGRLLSLDIDPASGWLCRAAAGPAEIRIGDTRDTLAAAVGPEIGLFVHDSLKTFAHETFELETVLGVAGPDCVLYTDDAAATGALPELCRRRGLRYWSVRERPRDHFWPGNALGIAVSS